MDQFERFLETIKDSQDFAPDDRLSRLIEKYDDCELSLDELDEIAAAASENIFPFDAEED